MNNAKLRGAKLSRSLYYTLIASSSALWVTGAAWLLFHYFGRSEGEFGIVTHPLESVMLQVHGFMLIPALLSLGGIVFGHIGSGWRYQKNKISGLSMLALFTLLAGTGYVLYYTGSDAIRHASSLAHWIAGLAAPAFFVKHGFLHLKRRTSVRPAAESVTANRNPALAA